MTNSSSGATSESVTTARRNPYLLGHIILLVIWVVLSIVGFVFDGLFWLGLIGVVLFVGTIIFGLIRRSAAKKKA